MALVIAYLRFQILLIFKVHPIKCNEFFSLIEKHESKPPVHIYLLSVLKADLLSVKTINNYKICKIDQRFFAVYAKSFSAMSSRACRKTVFVWTENLAENMIYIKNQMIDEIENVLNETQFPSIFDFMKLFHSALTFPLFQ